MFKPMKSLLIAALVGTCCAEVSPGAVTLDVDNRAMLLQTDALYNPGLSAVSDDDQISEVAAGVVGAFNPYVQTHSISSAVNQPQGLAMASTNATATQNSTVSTSVMDFEGTASGDSFSNIPGLGYSGYGDTLSHSAFNIIFTVTTPTYYSLNGTIEAIRSVSGTNSESLVQLTTGPLLNTPVFNSTISNPTPGIVTHQTVINNQTGLLAPGQYAFTAGAKTDSRSVNTSQSGAAAYDLLFTLTPIPEPSVLTLAVTAALIGAFHLRCCRGPM
jgi:hypothetical protein